MESDRMLNVYAIGTRRTIIERERRVNNFILRRLVHFFLGDKKMDTVDSQILDGAPPQKLIDPPIYNSRLQNDADDSMESIGISLARGASIRQGF
jgi:hypothetical protein